MNQCPACNNYIFEGSYTCDQCGQPINPVGPIQRQGQVQDQTKTKSRGNWFFKPTSLFLLFLLVGPLMLLVVWLHPQYSLKKKFVITAVVMGLTIGLVVLSAKALQLVWSFYLMLMGSV